MDTDPMLGWGALLPLMWVLDHIDIDPWNGFHFGSTDGADISLENIKMGQGLFSLYCGGGTTQLLKDGHTVFRSNATGRFRHFICEEHYSKVQVPPQEKQSWVEFPGKTALQVKINGAVVSTGEGCVELPVEESCTVELWR